MSSSFKSSRKGNNGGGELDDEHFDDEQNKRRGRPPGAKRSSKPKHKPAPVDEVDHHEDHCEACTDGGNLLCCDNCDFAFHFTCVDPPFLPDHPISEIDTWYCRRCAFMLRQKENPSKAPGPFGPIFDLSRSLNPHIFSLPTSIRRQSHAERDKAKDAREVELIDLLKNPDLCLPRYTAEEVVDTRRRKGKSCHICSLSDNSSMMVNCDTCKRVYHRYCLDPPPLGELDWVCPNATDAKHRTKSKKTVVKAANSLEKQCVEQEASKHLYELPVAIDFVSGWKRQETPTPIEKPPKKTNQRATATSISDKSDAAANTTKRSTTVHSTSESTPSLIGSKVKQQPQKYIHFKISRQKQAAAEAAAAAQASSTPNRTNDMPNDIRSILSSTSGMPRFVKPSSPAMPNQTVMPELAFNWGISRVEAQNTHFEDQYQALRSFLNSATRSDAANSTRTTAMLSATAVERGAGSNLTPTLPHLDLGTQAKCAVSVVGDTHQKFSHTNYYHELLPELSNMMNSSESNLDLLLFLGWQRLEEIYQYGMQLNTLENAMTMTKEMSPASSAGGGSTLQSSTGANFNQTLMSNRLPPSSSIYLLPSLKISQTQSLYAANAASDLERGLMPAPHQPIELEGGIPLPNNPKKRSLMDPTTLVPLPSKKSKTQEGLPVSKFPLTLFDSDWDAIVDQAIAGFAKPTNGSQMLGTVAASTRNRSSSSASTGNLALPGTNTPTSSSFASAVSTPYRGFHGSTRSPAERSSHDRVLSSSAGTVSNGSRATHASAPSSASASSPLSSSTPITTKSAGAPRFVISTSKSRALAASGGNPHPSSSSSSLPQDTTPIIKEENTSATSSVNGQDDTGHPSQEHAMDTSDSSPVDTKMSTPETKRRHWKQQQLQQHHSDAPSSSSPSHEIGLASPKPTTDPSSTLVTPPHSSSSNAESPQNYSPDHSLSRLQRTTFEEISKAFSNGAHSTLLALLNDRITCKELKKPVTTVGRGKTNICLSDMVGTKVSRHHADINHSTEGGVHHWTITVLGRHGIRRNGARVEADTTSELVDRDILSFGGTKFVFRTNPDLG